VKYYGTPSKERIRHAALLRVNAGFDAGRRF